MIRNSILVLTTMVVSVAAIPTSAARSGEEASKKRPLRIALVDVDKVLKEYKKGNDRYDEIKKQLEPLSTALRQQAQTIKDEQRRLATTPRTNRIEFEKRESKIKIQLLELERDEKNYLQQRTKKEIEAMMEVWTDVIACVSKYAKDNGIDLVIKQQVRSNTPSAKATFYHNVAARTVLYAAARLDITEAIIKQLNTDYERGRDAAKG